MTLKGNQKTRTLEFSRHHVLLLHAPHNKLRKHCPHDMDSHPPIVYWREWSFFTPPPQQGIRVCMLMLVFTYYLNYINSKHSPIYDFVI